MDKSSLFIIIGVVLILVFLTLYLLVPIYLSGYSEINEALKNTYLITKVSPKTSVIVLNITVSESKNTIYLISNVTDVYLQIINSSGLVANNTPVLIDKLSPGVYKVVISNPTNQTQYVLLRYSTFPYSELNSFYTTLGVITTASEFFVTLGIVILGYGIVIKLFGNRRKRKK